MYKFKTTIFLLALALGTKAQQYHFKNFSLNEGLPQSQVFALCEDKRGYIWMGTNGGGLGVFDGLEFTTYTTRNGLSSNYILSLCEDHTGRMWIGSNKGLSYFKNKNFYKHSLPVKGTAVKVITEDSQNQLWLGTDQGVYVRNDSTFSPIHPEIFSLPEYIISFIEEAPDHSIWVGTNKGVFILRDTLVEILGTKEGLSNSLTECMAVDSTGNIWIGNYGRGVDIITPTGIYNMNQHTGLDRAVVFSILHDKRGTVWIATQEKGLCKYNPSDSSYIHLNEKDGLANNHVKSLLQDHWGNYWMGTSGGGISKYSGQQFEQFTVKNGLPGNYIYSVTTDWQNNIWTGTSGGGITRYDGVNFIHYNADSGFVNEKTRGAFMDSDSLLWIGTEGKGLATFDGDTFQIYTTKHGLAGNWVKSIKEDSKGQIWVASAGGGISRILKTDKPDSLLFQKITTGNGLLTNRVTYLHIDKNDRVWFTTQSNGIGYIQNDTLVKHLGLMDGLASNEARSLAEDNFGNLWVGGTNGLNTLSLYEGPLQLREILNDELSSVNIYLLAVDAENNLWVGTERGLDRLKVDSTLSILESIHFGSADGFTGVETNLNAVSLDKSQNLWFGTVNGLHRYSSGADIENVIPPVLNFKEISLNYIPLESTSYGSYEGHQQEPVFEHNENHLTFDFFGVNQTIPGKVQYKWRLRGVEDRWSPPSKRSSITYSNLQPGSYHFEVLSANEDGIWNTRPLEFKFHIKGPFWKETWFLVTAAILFLLLLALFIGLQMRILNRKARERQEKLRMERDLISLEQKALRLQMNPHFIFHTLNNIQALIATKDEQTARVYLSRFSKLMRQILENSRSNEISLETEIETLQTYLSIERFCYDEKFDFNIEVEGDLETAFINIPPMILQPFVENAIIHGVAPLEQKGLINISFTEAHDQIICIIEDNGKGFKNSAGPIGGDHKSTALEVTRERLTILNKGAESILIENIHSENNESGGTKVLVRLPIIS